MIERLWELKKRADKVTYTHDWELVRAILLNFGFEGRVTLRAVNGLVVAHIGQCQEVWITYGNTPHNSFASYQFVGSSAVKGL